MIQLNDTTTRQIIRQLCSVTTVGTPWTVISHNADKLGVTKLALASAIDRVLTNDENAATLRRERNRCVRANGYNLAQPIA